MRTRDLITLAAAVCAFALAVALAGCGSSSSASSSSSSSTPTSPAASSSTSTATSSAPTAPAATIDGGPRVGYEAVPLEHGPELAPASTTAPGTVDGIKCNSKEQLVYHIHAHLAVFRNGSLYALPAGIGIPGSQTKVFAKYGPVALGGDCIHWLHTHTSDGIIHVESPLRSIFTLGNFFDVWHQPLSGDAIAGLHGKVSAFVDGRPWHRSPRAIPLLPHADIQLQIGEPIPPLVTVDWKRTGL